LHFFLIDTHTNNGSSGSPLFSSESGKVIGVVSGKISVKIPAPDGKIVDIPANIGLCRPAKYINSLLK
jgi:S1-C subfamily serine protease